MGTIVCQDCEGTIAHFEDEKVTVLYGKCRSCGCDHTEHTKAQ
ncbi:GapA-binding peptide SR1P [Bacillus sp. FSL K6-0067]|nr:GapA-binding peptide SR1P [Bacillus cereus]KXY17947.1 phosphoesterase [Bacillus cereus]